VGSNPVGAVDPSGLYPTGLYYGSVGAAYQYEQGQRALASSAAVGNLARNPWVMGAVGGLVGFGAAGPPGAVGGAALMAGSVEYANTRDWGNTLRVGSAMGVFAGGAAQVGTGAWSQWQLARMPRNAVEMISPSNLLPTHRLTLSRRELAALRADILARGIQEPLVYTEFRGGKYVLDGHHRRAVALMLQLQEVPCKRVELPWGGYHTTDDLFFW
jgi:hypothetical protein